MEPMRMPSNLLKTMTFHSDYCEHKYKVGGKEVVKRIQMILVDGQAVCPRCEAERETAKLQEIETERYEQTEYVMSEGQKKKRVFNRDSIVPDDTISKAEFSNYREDGPEETENKRKMIDLTNDLKAGRVFNIILQGNPGAGKSHLAYAALREINQSDLEVSCLFISIEDMMRRVRNSFSNKDSKYTESYFIELLSSVDFLALDDLGAETGAIGTDKQATDFVQRLLYAITTTRQDKATIVTTNLSGEELFKIYDSKMVSRLFRRPQYIVFKETKDKRRIDLPF
ncbi:ATP-binding protein [Pseudobacillus sp. FSL P4-0506]|uniref:ATP-binding protein n=1 Tax=Pseudobacillus sp. FSL P4-0506 TaxID=2921576 RepID=UPI0030F8A2D2